MSYIPRVWTPGEGWRDMPKEGPLCTCGHHWSWHEYRWGHESVCMSPDPQDTCVQFQPLRTDILGVTDDPERSFAEVVAEVVAEALGVLAGYASVCWSPGPRGVFQAEMASAAVDEATQLIIEAATRRAHLLTNE